MACSRYGATQVHERLNQILKVRHSFAHGSAVPSYPWNRTPLGRVRLNVSVLKDVEAFFTNLVRRTDRGMQAHILAAYGKTAPW